MPLWRARTRRDEGDPVGGVLVVFSGSLRNPHDADALDVSLGAQDGEIFLHADGADLGRWPATAVDIRRFGKSAFEFIAEGDRLIFTPDDPATFGDSPIVVGQDVEIDNHKRRRSKEKLDGAEPNTALGQDPFEEPRPAEREVNQHRTTGRARKRLRRRREAPVEPAGPDHEALNVVPDAPPTVPETIATTADEAHQTIDAASAEGRRERESPAVDDATSFESGERINSVWIRALDLARKYDTFGLDRVPIDPSLRGQDHQHTWDHRVAATSGLGQHICTICGAIRRKT